MRESFIEVVKKNIILIIFFLPFGFIAFASALLFSVLPVIDRIQTWQSARHWKQVPVQVIKAEIQVEKMRDSKGRDRYSHSLDVRYRYSWYGNMHEATAVDLLIPHASPDKEAWLDMWIERLIRAKEEDGEPVMAWVNPAQPDEAIIDRDMTSMHWWALVFAIMLGTMLLAIAWFPFFILWRLFQPAFQKKKESSAVKVAWKNRSNGGPSLRARYIFSFIWCFFSFPITGYILFGPASQISKNSWLWLIMLIPLLGILLIYEAIRSSIKLRQLGALALTFKTEPVQTGKAIEGSIKFEKPQNQSIKFIVILICEKLEIKSDGVARYTKHWQKQQTLKLNGNTLHFEFHLPASMPATNAEGENRYRWQIRIRNKEYSLDCEFDIEVNDIAINNDTKYLPTKEPCQNISG